MSPPPIVSVPVIPILASPPIPSIIPLPVVPLIIIPIPPVPRRAQTPAPAPAPASSKPAVPPVELPPQLPPNQLHVHKITVTASITAVLLELATRGLAEIRDRREVRDNRAAVVESSL